MCTSISKHCMLCAFHQSLLSCHPDIYSQGSLPSGAPSESASLRKTLILLDKMVSDVWWGNFLCKRYLLVYCSGISRRCAMQVAIMSALIGFIGLLLCAV